MVKPPVLGTGCRGFDSPLSEYGQEKGDVSMTKTIQQRSSASLNETVENLTVDKPKTEDNVDLLLQVLDSLNTLYERLNRLNYVIQRKNIELNILSDKEETK